MVCSSLLPFHRLPCTANYNLLSAQEKNTQGPLVARLDHLWQPWSAILGPWGDNPWQQNCPRWSGESVAAGYHLRRDSSHDDANLYKRE